MGRKKRKVQFHIILTPPDVFVDIGKHQLDLTQDFNLDFVPYPGLYIRLTPEFPVEKSHHWRSLIQASSGPKGAQGLGMNTDIWQVDKVFYDLKQKQFWACCYPELDTSDQFHALRELLTEYHGFRIDRHAPK